jgi:hypothetical protein
MTATIAQSRSSETGLPIEDGAANVQLAASLGDIDHPATAMYRLPSEVVRSGMVNPGERRQVIPVDQESTLLASVLFDLAFLGLGGAPLISTIDVRSGLVSLAVGVLAAVAGRAIRKLPRCGWSRSDEQPVLSRLLAAAA